MYNMLWEDVVLIFLMALAFWVSYLIVYKDDEKTTIYVENWYEYLNEREKNYGKRD